MKTTCSKVWPSVPFAHRAPFHDGHCRFIHGHNWTVEAVFGCLSPDSNGFVFDFGKLKDFRRYLDGAFDHSLVLSDNDPEKERIIRSLGELAKVVTVPDCSCEGLALHFFDWLNRHVTDASGGRAFVESLTLWEDEKNSATVTRA